MFAKQRRLRFMLAALSLALVAVWPAAGRTGLAASPGPLGMSCNNVLSTDGVAYTFCTGKIATFDGVPLDTDLTVPAEKLQNHLPLLVMVGGDDNHKTEWESATVRNPQYPPADGYNNVAFAHRGYAVLTYSSRGAFGSCSPYGDPMATPPEPPDPTVPSPTGPCRNARVDMPDRRFEIHDLKYLAGLLVDAGVADADHIGITGFSAGGATTLLAALEDNLITAPDGSTSAWRSPGGIPLHVAAAVPYAGYTDVIDLMAPNGRAGDGILIPDGDRLQPAGVPVPALDAGEPAIIASNGMLIAPAHPAAGPDAFFVVAPEYLAGEPFNPNPAFTDAGQQLVRWKSAYYQDALIERDANREHEVPIFFVYGWTDLFVTPVQATSLISKLKAADGDWPINLILADIGHTGQNTLADWDPIHEQLRAFLDYHLRSRPLEAQPEVSARVIACDGSSGAVLQADSLRDLAPHRLVLGSDAVQRTASVPVGQPVSLDVCPSQLDPTGAAAWRWPVTRSTTMAGLPLVRLSVRVTGTDADLMTRLWDVNPATGQRVLVTRGVYKYHGSGGTATVAYGMLGSAWTFAAGHQIELEVAQDDAPLFQPDNLPSAVEYASVTLTLPTTGPGDSDRPGGESGIR